MFKEELDSLLDKKAGVFAAPGSPYLHKIKHRIKIIDKDLPLPQTPQYMMSPTEQEEVKIQVREMLEKGWIRPSTSPYGHPVLFVKKKTE